MNFNSQPHEEADHRSSSQWFRHLHFNSQPHEEADRLIPMQNYQHRTFQLTASRRGWRRDHCEPEPSDSISTHSLTKRLTVAPSHPSCWSAGFQLTASRRGWRWKMRRMISMLMYFNSQPHEEADTLKLNKVTSYFIFQLTASRRGWRNCRLSGNQMTHFNSQPHEEADLYRRKFTSGGQWISTHSLTKRLTLLWM